MDAMLRRRMMMMEVGGSPTPPTPVLPYDAEIEYLESSGTQYINTGVVPTNSTGIYIEYTRLNTTDSYCCGLRDTTGDTRWCIGTVRQQTYYGWGTFTSNQNISFTSGNAALNYLNSRKFNVNGTDKYSLPSLPFTPINGIRIFGSSGVSDSYTKWTGRIMAVKISNGDSVIMDLIPVRVGQVGYMYDRVSGELLGNSGSGNFILGNDITQ